MTTQTLDFNNIERKIFWILASSLCLAMAFYLYSVASLTIAVVDRDQMKNAAHELAVKSSAIEEEYLTRASSITLAYAQSLGFQEVAVKFAGGAGAADPKLSLAR